MRKQILKIMKCVKCGSSDLRISTEIDTSTVYNSKVFCRACDTSYSIVDGIFRLKIDDDEVKRESIQWEKFAETEGWLEPNIYYLESLPSAGANILMPEDTIGWLTHEYNFFKMLKSLKIEGASILDLGAGRCWSSKWMSMMGGEVIAFDAMEHPTLGLGAGAHYMKNHDIYFDRISGDFNQLPFKDETFDIVLSTGSMHHSNDLDLTFREVSRVLKKQGVLSIVNEPVGSIRLRDERIKLEGAQDGINEHEYRITRYLSLFKKYNLNLSTLNETVSAYERSSFYSQGPFASVINRTRIGSLCYLVLFGGVLNCTAIKNK